MTNENQDPLLFPLGELTQHGLLWLINKTVFHPRGFALAFATDDDGRLIGWGMMGNGSEPWQFTEEIDAQEFPRVEAFLNSLRPPPPPPEHEPYPDFDPAA